MCFRKNSASRGHVEGPSRILSHVQDQTCKKRTCWRSCFNKESAPKSHTSPDIVHRRSKRSLQPLHPVRPSPCFTCVLYPFTMAEITDNGFNAITAACETNLREIIPQSLIGDRIQKAISQDVRKPVSTCIPFDPSRRTMVEHCTGRIIDNCAGGRRRKGACRAFGTNMGQI